MLNFASKTTEKVYILRMAKYLAFLDFGSFWVGYRRVIVGKQSL